MWKEMKYNINVVAEKILLFLRSQQWIKIRNSLKEIDYDEYKKIKNKK